MSPGCNDDTSDSEIKIRDFEEWMEQNDIDNSLTDIDAAILEDILSPYIDRGKDDVVGNFYLEEQYRKLSFKEGDYLLIDTIAPPLSREDALCWSKCARTKLREIFNVDMGFSVDEWKEWVSNNREQAAELLNRYFKGLD